MMKNMIKVSKEITMKFVEEKFNVKVHGVFSYGSAVYGYKKPSDLDFIVITDKPMTQTSFELDNVEIQITFYSIEEYKKLLENEEISVLETLSTYSVSIEIDEECKYLNPMVQADYSKDLHDIFMKRELVNKPVIRSSISKKSSNSYVKAKKKIIVSDDFDLKTSLKSLWHSFRMVDFGIQLCKHNDIYNFKSQNELYKEIVEDYLDFYKYESPQEFWDFIHAKYKPMHNEILKEFRLVAPQRDRSKNSEKRSTTI